MFRREPTYVPFDGEDRRMIVGVAFHILAAVVWVGGMFFAYMILRPSAGPLDPVIRLTLWHRVFSRFLVWVWWSVAVVLVSGFAMILLGLGGFSAVAAYVRVMMVLGIIMTTIYTYLYFLPWPRFRRAVSMEEWPAADATLQRIRFIIGVN